MSGMPGWYSSVAAKAFLLVLRVVDAVFLSQHFPFKEVTESIMPRVAHYLPQNCL